MVLLVNYAKYLKYLKPRLLKYFQKFKEEGTLSIHLMRHYPRQG